MTLYAAKDAAAAAPPALVNGTCEECERRRVIICVLELLLPLADVLAE